MDTLHERRHFLASKTARGWLIRAIHALNTCEYGKIRGRAAARSNSVPALDIQRSKDCTKDCTKDFIKDRTTSRPAGEVARDQTR